MRILFISNLYPPNVVGGYERLCHDVAMAFVARGHHVSVLTSTYGSRRQDYPGQSIHRTLRLLADGQDIYKPFSATEAERRAINEANLSALQQVIDSEAPDVIFAWNLFFFDRSLLQGLEQSGRRVVAMLTDNWLIVALDGPFMAKFFAQSVFGSQPLASTRPAGLMDRLRPWRRQPQRSRFSLGMDAVFGSNFMRDLYQEAGLGFASHRVIHNGVRIDARPPEAFRDRSSLIDPEVLSLLFAGRLVDLKGAHTLIEALPQLRDRIGDRRRLKLTIVGDPQDRAYWSRLNALIESTRTADLILFAEPVAEGALFDLFQNHDLYIFPSLYEPFSLTLILALAAGIPTIASSAGGNREIVHHGKTGMVFEKGDAEGLAQTILALADDPQLRRRISLGGRRAANRFTFERMVAGMERYLVQ